MIPKNVKKKLEKMQYRFAGEHSAVQVCMWTKKALKGEGFCWKEKFYGISSAGCCQMSPSVMWCENSCIHCWRPIEMNLGKELSNANSPIEILDKITEERKRLLYGLKGSDKVNKKLFEEALTPSLYTFSLSGEPTIYPRLGEMFKEIRKRGAISFLVTNGQNPKTIEKLKKQNSLPTQLTLSVNAPNKKLFNQWHNSSNKDSWDRFLETINLFNSLEGKVRRALRLTLVKKGKGETPLLNDITNMSNENIKEYVDLIKKAKPDFIHVKGYMSLGYARERMGYDKQPWFYEIQKFSIELQKQLIDLDYYIVAQEEKSNVILISKKGTKLTIEDV